MENISVVRLFKKYVRNTLPKQIVVEETVFVDNLTNAVCEACQLRSSKVYINTKVIKHLYDRKPAEEFDFLIRNIQVLVKFPDKIYKNKDSKRGDFCFVKKIKDENYLCSLEIAKEPQVDGTAEEIIFVVTCFRVRDERYLRNYELFWSWKGGTPSS